MKFDYAEMNCYSPEGKPGQLERAQTASELGSTCLALKNNNAGVIIAHNPPRSKLAEPSKKIFEIEPSTLFAFAGITNDGLCMVDYLENKHLYETVERNRKMHPVQVFEDFTYGMSYSSLVGDSRLCGASGILLTEFEDKIVLVESKPNKTAKEVYGCAIGSRNYSCKTVLEDDLENFIDPNCTSVELIQIGLKAMKNAHPENDEVNVLKPEDLEIFLIEIGKPHQKINPTEVL